MKQLFVCHTQYNLILASGISERCDDLILFKDFDLKDDLKKKLEDHFERCLFLCGNYPKKELTSKEKLEKISRDNKSLKSFIARYDRIFIVDDMCIQEMYALKCAYKKNRSVEMAWLEDGANAYFKNSSISKGMGSTPFKRFLRKIVFTVKYGLFGFYDLGECMGAHFRLSHIYVCFPEYVRPELMHKKKVEIKNGQFISGMRFMYQGAPCVMDENCMIIALDLLSVYGDSLTKVDDAVKELKESAVRAGKTVYCKYHPRETETLPALGNVITLDSRIGIENYLINTTAKHMTVVGFKSTALQIAKKMGFDVISLVKLIDDDCAAITGFYTSLCIVCK